MATISNIQCPWKKFYKQAVKYMKSLHIETCEPQMKIARFMYAVKHNFASTTMDLTKDSKKSTKQLQGSKSIMFKIMAQNPSSSTSHSDTDSAYSTEVEINYTEHLPRPPCISKTNKTTLKNTSSTFSKILKKPADHKVQPGDQTFLHPHSNQEHQQAQSSKHLNTPTKAKCFYMTKHPNYCKATDSTCTKDVYSIIHTSAQEKHYYLLHHHQQETSTTGTITNNTSQDHHQDTAHIQPSQDLHRYTTHIQPSQDQQTTDTTHSNTFQDHILHSSQDHTNRPHYYQYQHYQHHTSRYQDTFNKYTMFQSYYRNCYNITPDEDRN